MKSGDLVRFRQCTWHVEPKRYTNWNIGLLLEYSTLSKMGTILFEGEHYRVRGENIQLHKQAKRKRHN